MFECGHEPLGTPMRSMANMAPETARITSGGF